jgi:NAD+ kinase
MRVAIFGKSITKESRPFLENLHAKLQSLVCEISINRRFNRYIQEHCDLNLSFDEYASHEELAAFKPDFLMTLGGDGTILDAVTFVRDSGIPILGVNLGRLGFLSNVSKEKLHEALDALAAEAYSIDERFLLNMESDALELDMNFALNEIAVSRKDTTAMITVHAYINDEYVNSYWADGLIVATPTGSTGYSLSCGGPIIMPGSENFVITPIAPHNLNVRPFVIPNKYEIRLRVEGREKQFLVSLDSRIYSIESGSELRINLEQFRIKLIKTEVQNFSSTLRNKLLWGLDRRN